VCHTETQAHCSSQPRPVCKLFESGFNSSLHREAKLDSIRAPTATLLSMNLTQERMRLQCAHDAHEWACRKGSSRLQKSKIGICPRTTAHLDPVKIPNVLWCTATKPKQEFRQTLGECWKLRAALIMNMTRNEAPSDSQWLNTIVISPHICWSSASPSAIVSKTLPSTVHMQLPLALSLATCHW